MIFRAAFHREYMAETALVFLKDGNYAGISRIEDN